MIRQLSGADDPAILEVIVDAAIAYQGVIPADCWQEPYMSDAELRQEIAAGVEFFGWEEHAQLLAHLRGRARGRLLVGTWAAATWAIRFYKHRGFSLVAPEEKDRLLTTYWTVLERQREASVVLSTPDGLSAGGSYHPL